MSRYTKANHRIFMQFVRRDVWHDRFARFDDIDPGQCQVSFPEIHAKNGSAFDSK